VLAQQLSRVAELGHLLRQHGEYVLLLDRVVRVQVRAKLQAGLQKLPERKIFGTRVVARGGVEERPRLAEVVVLKGKGVSRCGIWGGVSALRARRLGGTWAGWEWAIYLRSIPYDQP
jgi:hypothetical protein